MFDDPTTTAISNESTPYVSDVHNFYVTFYDVAKDNYINQTGNSTEVSLYYTGFLPRLHPHGINKK